MFGKLKERKRLREQEEQEEQEKVGMLRRLLEEKVFTISAGEYCKVRGRELTDYNIKGVHYQEFLSGLIDFARIIPPEAEAIVSFQQTTGGGGGVRYYIASGTALIPKK